MIQISYSDAKPIYEKVKDSLCRMILTGALPPDSRLPSVRELAMELAINPNTIQRAYRELEAEGYICSVPGRGSFVRERSDAAAARRRQLLEQFDAFTAELKLLGLSGEDLAERVRGDHHD